MNIDTSSDTTRSDLLIALQSRRSVPSKQLGAPGPDEATQLRMLGWMAPSGMGLAGFIAGPKV